MPKPVIICPECGAELDKGVASHLRSHQKQTDEMLDFIVDCLLKLLIQHKPPRDGNRLVINGQHANEAATKKWNAPD